MKTDKRNDLQCWRAFSILAVLLFHIWPKITPNGFVGVDIFFVISGFFMSKLYFNRKFFNHVSFFDFYFKRVKRITPLYFVVILFLITSLSYSIQDWDFDLALSDFKWASVFLTNFQDKLTNLNYFSVTSRFHFFRHCWSLSVEMQFYLIFPIIAFLQTKIPNRYFQIFLITLFLASLLFQHTRKSPIDYYENTISRLWQFMVGIIAAQLNFEVNKMLCKFLFVLSCVVAFCPITLAQGVASFISVILAAVIIIFSSSKYSPFDHLPFYSGMVYLGDISYILYLVHWPIITYQKYCTINSTLNPFEGIIAGLGSIMVAVILHESLEKPLIKYCNSFQRLLAFLMMAYLLTFYCIPATLISTDENYSPLTQEFINNITNFSLPLELPGQWTRKNDIEFSKYIKKLHTYVGSVTVCDKSKDKFVESGSIYTHFCEIESTLKGNLTAMLIGNSYAHNVLPVIAANPMLKKLISMTAFGCLYVKNPQKNCQNFQKAVDDAMEKMKPDIIYFIQGYVSVTLGTKAQREQREKTWKGNFRHIFEVFQKHSSVIITNHQHFRFRQYINSEFLRRKYFGFDIGMMEKKRPTPTSLDQVQLSVPCEKCIWINYNDVICQREFCSPIDPITGLPMFLDEDHITIVGAKRVQPLFDNATLNALKLIKT